MVRLGRYVGVPPGRRERQNRMIRIVEGVNDVMRCTGMVWVLLVDVERNGAGQRLDTIAFAVRTETKQRERVKRGGIQIIGILVIDLFHGD